MGFEILTSKHSKILYSRQTFHVNAWSQNRVDLLGILLHLYSHKIVLFIFDVILTLSERRNVVKCLNF